MDVASVIHKSPSEIVGSTRRLCPNGVVAVTFAIFLSVSANLSAQTELVQVVLEPRLETSPIPGPPNRLKQEKLEVVEPNRMQIPKSDDQSRKEDAGGKSPSKNRASNFLPPHRPIGQVNIDLRSKPKNGNNAVPENLAEQVLGQSPVVHASTSDDMLGDMVFAKSRNHDELFAHHPLYFEEANLERYGRTCGQLQPALSGLRFFATIPSLPYAMTVHNPYKTYTTLWPYEAGWGAPKVKELRPLEVEPSLVQAGVITGLLFVLP